MAAILNTSAMTGAYVGTASASAIFLGTDVVWAPESEFDITAINVSGTGQHSITIKDAYGNTIAEANPDGSDKNTCPSVLYKDAFEIFMCRWLNTQSTTVAFFLKGPFFGTYTVYFDGVALSTTVSLSGNGYIDYHYDAETGNSWIEP